MIICCPKCGKRGFLHRRWVKSSYYPKYESEICERLQMAEATVAERPENEKLSTYIRSVRKKVKGFRYRKGVKGQDIDKNSVYRVSSDKYWHYYIGHYDSKKFMEQMNDYRNGKRKSRPNGRKWCKVPMSKYYLLVAK